MTLSGRDLKLTIMNNLKELVEKKKKVGGRVCINKWGISTQIWKL